jgi:hypothetical protein
MAGAEPAMYLEGGTKRKALPTVQGAFSIRWTAMPQATGAEAAGPITLLSAPVYGKMDILRRQATPGRLATAPGAAAGESTP